MKYDFIVFGGTGQQGKICSRDLLESGYSVLLVGRDPREIKDLLRHKNAKFLKVDLRNQKDIEKAIKYSGAEVVVNCAELVFNVPVMKAALANGKPCTDLGGLQKITIEQFKLDSAFRKKGVLCITGCGSTPGIVNIMAAHVLEDYDSVETIDAGFAWDSNMKVFVVPYSIKSIFDEFNEDPIMYENGKFVKGDKMSCQATRNFMEIGKQTTYCIVHSEVYTFPRYFKNKGLRNVHYMAGFPEHSINKIRTLLDLDFDSNRDIKIKDVSVKPVDFTTEVLKRLPQPKGYKEKENLWVFVDGKINGKNKETEVNCIVKTLKGWEDAGSNVNTGRTISIISQMIYEGDIKAIGVHAPEGVVPHRSFFKELGKRKMYIYKDRKRIN